GDEQTYVFFKDGLETFVIRPGFSGKVEDFGMLISFPTPPALRKVSEDIFPQISKAIDPPEVATRTFAGSSGGISTASPTPLARVGGGAGRWSTASRSLPSTELRSPSASTGRPPHGTWPPAKRSGTRPPVFAGP